MKTTPREQGISLITLPHTISATFKTQSSAYQSCYTTSPPPKVHPIMRQPSVLCELLLYAQSSCGIHDANTICHFKTWCGCGCGYRREGVRSVNSNNGNVKDRFCNRQIVRAVESGVGYGTVFLWCGYSVIAADRILRTLTILWVRDGASGASKNHTALVSAWERIAYSMWCRIYGNSCSDQ